MQEKSSSDVEIEAGTGASSPGLTVVGGRRKLGVAAHKLRTWGVEARGECKLHVC